MYHQAVYNGSNPEKWFSKRMFLLGDAAHPYGPGGQGISMAMLDAEALSDLLSKDFTAQDQANYQETRAAVAKEKGESSEKRNKPNKQTTSKLALWGKGLLMIMVWLFKGGKMEV